MTHGNDSQRDPPSPHYYNTELPPCGRGYPVRAQCTPFWAITQLSHPKRMLTEKALDSNIGTKKTATKWVSHQSLVVLSCSVNDILIVHSKMVDVEHIDIHLQS